MTNFKSPLPFSHGLRSRNARDLSRLSLPSISRAILLNIFFWFVCSRRAQGAQKRREVGETASENEGGKLYSALQIAGRGDGEIVGAIFVCDSSRNASSCCASVGKTSDNGV